MYLVPGTTGKNQFFFDIKFKISSNVIPDSQVITPSTSLNFKIFEYFFVSTEIPPSFKQTSP